MPTETDFVMMTSLGIALVVFFGISVAHLLWERRRIKSRIKSRFRRYTR